MKIEFEDFCIGSESAKLLINPYWLEHLLNLFYQGYRGEVWEEIEDTKMNAFKNLEFIETIGYGTIAKEFDSQSKDKTAKNGGAK